jgi:hypothetical protein
MMANKKQLNMMATGAVENFLWLIRIILPMEEFSHT